MTEPPYQTPSASQVAALQEGALDLIDDEINALLAELDGSAPLLHRMASYHLGLVTSDGEPIPVEQRRGLQGKRLRPLLALLACVAAGGEVGDAAPLAVAIELLHNFTLIHDDIQDRSPTRRHRPTVWRIWGDAQAINAGDALFAAAQIGLLNSASPAIPADYLIVVARAFNRMTIDIVRGQALDLGFEGRGDVSTEGYLTMIGGKTAAIVQFAAWAGALLGGADIAAARGYAVFGQALGLGFQVRDDALGVWGASDETGKDTGDDIRRRKQSLPVVLLRESVSPADRDALDRLYGGERVADYDVATVLAMLDRYGIAAEVESRVRCYHDEAVAALDSLADGAEPVAIAALRALTDRLAVRTA